MTKQHFNKIPPGFTGLQGLENTEALSFAALWVAGTPSFALQTSGSTGLPKTITVRRSQMEASAKATLEFLNLGKEDKALIALDPKFIGGKMMIVRCLIGGMQAHIQAPVADPLRSYPVNHGFRFTAMVPMQLQNILHRDKGLEQIQGFKAILIGGAPVSHELERLCKVHQLPVWQTYGMTETVSHIAVRHLGKGQQRYQTLPGVHIGKDDRSCLWVRGPMTLEEVVQTNDLVEIKDINQFSWLGRIDFVINSGGLKLHPELLEKQIQSLGLVHQPFVLLGVPDEVLGDKLVMLMEGSEVPAPEVQEAIKLHLGSKYAPKNYKCVPSLAYIGHQKINRKACYELYLKA